MATYRNPEYNVSFKHRDLPHPVRTLDELSDLVRGENKDGGRRVKLIGGRHTFSHLLKTEDYLVDTSEIAGMAGVFEVNQSKKTAVIGGATVLADAIDALAKKGLHFRSMGGWYHQTIAGLIATSTHGSSLALGSFSEDVLGVEVITADGEKRWIEDDSDEMKAWRCHLGRLGIVTKVKFQLAGEFWLRVENDNKVREKDGFDHIQSLLKTDPARIRRPFVNMLWMPYREKCWIRTLVKTSKRKRSRRALSLEKDAIDLKTNRLYDMHREAVRAFKVGCDWLYNQDKFRGIGPASLGRLYQFGIVERFTNDHGLVDRSFRVFPYMQYDEPAACQQLRSVNNVEYTIDGRKLPTVWKEMREVLWDFKEGEDKVINYPRIHIRFANASDRTLIGLNQGHRTVYIGTYFAEAMDPERRNDEIAIELGKIMTRAAGRPHWGKYRYFDDDMAFTKTYPHWSKFEKIRARLDPKGVFSDSANMFKGLDPKINQTQIRRIVKAKPDDIDPDWFPIDLRLLGAKPSTHQTQSKAAAKAKAKKEEAERKKRRRRLRRRRGR